MNENVKYLSAFGTLETIRSSISSIWEPIYMGSDCNRISMAGINE